MSTQLPPLRERGFEALREGDLDGAIDFLVQALAAEPHDVEAQMFLGVAYSQKGLHVPAKQALEAAVELRPREPRCHFNLGVALENAGDRAGALHAYRRALQIEPEYTEARAKIQALSDRFTTSSFETIPGSPLNTTASPAAPWLTHAVGSDSTSPVAAGTALETGHWRAPAEEQGGLLQVLADWMHALLSPDGFFRDQVGREGIKAPIRFLGVYVTITILVNLLTMLSGRYPWLPPHPGPVVLGVIAAYLVITALLALPMEFVWAGIVHATGRIFGGRGSFAGSLRASVYALAPLPILSLVSMLILMIAAPQFPEGLYPERAAMGERSAETARLLTSRPGEPGPSAAGLTGVGDAVAPASGNQPDFPPGTAGGAPAGAVVLLSLAIGFLSLAAYLTYLGVGVRHLHRLRPGAAMGVAITAGVMFFVFAMAIGMGFAALLVATHAMAA